MTQVTKAYLSEASIGEELRYCLRQGHDEVAEAQRILADAEHETGSVWCPQTDHVEIRTIARLAAHADRARAYKQTESVAWLHRRALRDALDYVTADGGPLDQLAWLSLRTVEDGPASEHEWAVCSRAYLANAQQAQGGQA